MNFAVCISEELSLDPGRVNQVIELLDAGNTVPFIARYRKEMTGGMDDQAIRKISERLETLRAFEKRRDEVLLTLEKQGVLTDELRRRLLAAEKVAEIEDLYRPYRQKRRTRASVAEERGLSPLADYLMRQTVQSSEIEKYAVRFVSEDRGVGSVTDALQGARDILAGRMSDDADCRKRLRRAYTLNGTVTSKASTDQDTPYSMYYDYSEPVSRIPDHRILAISRGESEGILKVRVDMEKEIALRILRQLYILPSGIRAGQIETAMEDAWDRLIQPSLERELRTAMYDRACESALEIFGSNLHQLLMQRPVKGHVTLGVDPGFRTGCKLAVVDANGKVLQTGVAHFTLPGRERLYEEAREIVGAMIRRNKVTAIAIGNGTASRESEAFIAELVRELPGKVQYAIVNEAGASVYSASEAGAEEFPQYDVTIRSAISIARRLQDPLAELVKIDPRSIGVGQYQHELKEAELSGKLEGVVESCVSSVGVDLSTASASLLTHVAGIGPALAKNIVAYREEHGFASRDELKKVPKLGPKAFKQAAGFLRIGGAANYLDSTAVHPESYGIAEELIRRMGYTMRDMDGGRASQLREKALACGLEALAAQLNVGVPTLKDILDELVKPGRDPREDLPPVELRSDVLDLKDLKRGMKLRGTVRNIVDFGVFVDIGVHQDGLVHISRMVRKYIRHPSEAARIGDVVDVWVLDADVDRKRISLSMLEPE